MNFSIMKNPNVSELEYIKGIKALRGLTGLGLKEAKDIFDVLRYGDENTVGYFEVNGHLSIEYLNAVKAAGTIVSEVEESPVRKEVREIITELVSDATKNKEYNVAMVLINFLMTCFPTVETKVTVDIKLGKLEETEFSEKLRNTIEQLVTSTTLSSDYDLSAALINTLQKFFGED